ncbi:hypothetical protein [Aquirufa aurantiipilula]|uniref:hypothetical protein n=1 Tax=Aquirufa aurantiipilula TaxID=2696561 RepID=UPI001CAA7BD6|nr:hypothetical protein [Aquirufa aurantiipilula]MBZ1327215.1 hypothetical protein [Aquirufa aurantiipilula]
MKELVFSKTLKILFYYIIIIWVNGIVRSEMIISVLNDSIILITRISSLLTLSISCLVSFVVICIIFVIPWYLVRWQNIDISNEIYLASTNFAIYVLITNEIIKLFFLILVFSDEIKSLAPDFKIEQLNDGYYAEICKYLDLIFTVLAIFIFGIELKFGGVNSIFDIAITSLFLLFSVSIVYVLFAI